MVAKLRLGLALAVTRVLTQRGLWLCQQDVLIVLCVRRIRGVMWVHSRVLQMLGTTLMPIPCLWQRAVIVARHALGPTPTSIALQLVFRFAAGLGRSLRTVYQPPVSPVQLEHTVMGRQLRAPPVQPTQAPPLALASAALPISILMALCAQRVLRIPGVLRGQASARQTWGITALATR